MRSLLFTLLALFVGTSGCLSSCDGVLGGGVDSVLADPVDSVLAPPVDGDDAPVGVQWTIPPVFEYAGYLQSEADSTAIETPECRGTLCATLALTQATEANRPVLRTLCPVGATTKPCFRVDGTDFVADASARAELRFLHDGTGMTCVEVYETSTTAQQGIMHTGDTGGGAPGFSFWIFNAQSYALWQNATTATTLATGAVSTPLNQTHAIMAIDLVSDTPDMAVFLSDFTTALATGSLATRDTGNSNNPLRWGGQWAGASNVTGYIPLLACWDQRLTTAEREAEQANMEAYFGGTFPL